MNTPDVVKYTQPNRSDFTSHTLKLNSCSRESVERRRGPKGVKTETLERRSFEETRTVPVCITKRDLETRQKDGRLPEE